MKNLKSVKKQEAIIRLVFIKVCNKNLISNLMESRKKLSNEEILSNIYYDLEKGYGSVRSLYELAKEEGATTTLEEVRHFMKKQPNKQIKGYNNYNSYLVPYARAEFQIDIMDMKMFMQEGEERYALVVIDAFSKLTNVVPMKNKDGKNV